MKAPVLIGQMAKMALIHPLLYKSDDLVNIINHDSLTFSKYFIKCKLNESIAAPGWTTDRLGRLEQSKGG